MSTSKAGEPSNQTGVVSGRPWARGWTASALVARIEPGQKKTAGSTPVSAFLTGSPSWSMAKPAAESRATSVPPASTKARSAATPSDPRPPVYSSGIDPGAWPFSSEAGAWSGRTIASKRSRRRPPRTSRSWSSWYATPISFSKTKRVQPSSIEGTHER